jgi:ERCC4-type nuclease
VITLDDRVGAVELLKHFPAGMAEVSRLQFGDAMFVGNGAEGPCLVGVERKRIGDLVNSIANGRLSGHQLIGLCNAYNVTYLVVEGLYRPAPKDGLLEVWRHGHWGPLEMGKRRFMARDVWAYLETWRMVMGVGIWHTASPDETAHWIRAIHYWWTHKDWAEHRGHLQPQTRPEVELVRHTLVRRVAQQLKGVGWERAKTVDGAFRSVMEMVAAGPEDWAEMEGFGDKLSHSVVAELRGGVE